MKPKSTPAKIETTIERPVLPQATVTITINGQTHKLTEDEAKELHAKLTKTLGIEPEKDPMTTHEERRQKHIKEQLAEAYEK